MRKALAVGRKEFRQIRRDRRTLMILLFIPVFFLLLYGYALNFDIKHVKLAVEDRDLSPESRRLVSAFVNSGYFDQVASVTTEREIVDLMDRDRIRAALIIPRGLGRDVTAWRAGERRGSHQRRERQHGDNRPGLRVDRDQHRVVALPGTGDGRVRAHSSSSNPGSGTTPTCAARSSWCRACWPTSG